MKQKITDIIAKYMFIASCTSLIFLYGYMVGFYKIFPFSYVFNINMQIYNIANKPPVHFLRPAKFSQKGVTQKKSSKMSGQFTLITSSFRKNNNWLPGIKLIDSNGDIIHEWWVDVEVVCPGVYYPYIHGSYLFNNGDVLINIEYVGLLKLDYRSNVIWRLDCNSHHSMFRDENDFFWVCSTRQIKEHSDRISKFPTSYLPGLFPPFQEDVLLQVTPGGKIIRELSILEILRKNNLWDLLYKSNEPVNRDGDISGDITHLNDVEILSNQMAQKFPDFTAGDILFSMRNIHTIVVVDGITQKVKYCNSNDFILQHDPDFTKEGTISVFDNRIEFTGGSRIVTVNPTSGATTVTYDPTGDKEFYSPICGKHQILENGNILITEACTGRVFEITPDSEIVWEWIHEKYNENLIPEVYEGTRYYYDKKTILSWKK